MKEYPLTTNGKCKINVCECGHAEITHSILHGAKCNNCTCLHYTFELRIGWFEYMKQIRLRRKKEEKLGGGFTV